MGVLSNLYDRLVTKPVTNRILESLTKANTAAKPPAIFSVPTGFNSAMSSFNKRMTTSTVDFPTLRSLSINHETTRAAINTRKRQITQLGYDIVDTDDDIDPETTAIERQKIKDAVTNLGGEGIRFRALLDKIIEDVLVLDALCFYKQRDRGGRLIRIIPVDGATIKLRVDESGARPLPPDIAFEQWIKGAKVTDLTTNEMTYDMMNPRTDSPYGLSPIESMIITLDSSMRAMLYNLHYLSDNNIPQGFISMPENWSPDQIKEYKEWFDATVSGSKNTNKVYPIPSGATYQAVSKPSDYAFADFFEYLDRKVCMLFDLSPQELGINLKMYKDNAEGQEKIQIRKGIKPLANFLSEIFTDIIKYEYGYTQYAFKFNGLDGRFSTEDVTRLLPVGVISIDEARNDRGLKKLGVDNFVMGMGQITPVAQIAQMTVSGTEQDDSNLLVQEEEQINPDPNGQLAEDSNGDEETGKMEKQGKKRKVNPFNYTMSTPRYATFKRAIQAGLSKQIRPFTDAAMIERVVNYQKDAVSSGVSDYIDGIDIEDLEGHLNWASKQGGNSAYDTLGISGVFQTNPQLQEYLTNRKNYIINSVDNTSKDFIINQISQGKEQSLTNEKIAENIADQMPEITDARADMIVRTEVANAMSTAALDVYKDQGVTQKVWNTYGAQDELCLDNEAAGAIGINDEFPSGDVTNPGHPNCICQVDPVVDTIGLEAAEETEDLQKDWVTLNGAHVLLGGGGAGSGGDEGSSGGTNRGGSGSRQTNHTTTATVSTPPATPALEPKLAANMKEQIAMQIEGLHSLDAEASIPAGIADKIRGVDVKGATTPDEVASRILSALPKSVQNAPRMVTAVTNWAKQTKVLADYRNSKNKK